MWERWNSYTIEDGFGDIGMNSFNHYAYGSVGEWMFQSILGIDADDSIPAFKKIIMKPSPDKSMSYAKGQYKSVYGTIKSSWKLSDENYRFEITIPANAYAKLYLPVLNSESITENGTPISQLSEIKIIGVEENNTVLEVGSGSYIFEIPVMNTSFYNKEIPDFLTIYPNPTEDSLTKRH